METGCIQGLEKLPPSVRDSVLTIGNFDGVHLGHQRILQAARALANAERAAVVVLTFEPPPDLVLRPDDPPQRITLPDQKVHLLRAGGADSVVVARADRQLLAMSPQAFLERLIVERFSPRHLVEGQNFFFGRDRAGTIDTLAQAAPACGFVLHKVDPVTVELPAGPQRVSSTLIRGLILSGHVEQANRCLGREFTLHPRVVRGQSRGRGLGFPTVNVDPGEQVVPADGVYAGRARLNGNRFAAAVSIGNKPTIGPTERTIEAFLIDASGNFYDRQLALSIVCRIREQRRFDTPQQLQAQIARDVERVREICGQGV